MPATPVRSHSEDWARRYHCEHGTERTPKIADEPGARGRLGGFSVYVVEEMLLHEPLGVQVLDLEVGELGCTPRGAAGRLT